MSTASETAVTTAELASRSAASITGSPLPNPVKQASGALRSQVQGAAGDSDSTSSTTPHTFRQKSTSSTSTGHYSPHDDVLLGVEAISEGQTRVLMLSMRLKTVVAVVLLIVLANFKLSKPDSFLLKHNRLVLINLGGGAVCLALLIYHWVVTLHGTYTVCKRRRHWTRRRIYFVSIVSAELSIHTLNVIFFMAANAYVLAHKCAWFSSVVRWLGIAQWTCWNTLFFLLLVLASNTLPWIDKSGKQQSGRMDANLADAPITVHAPKLLIWVIYEVLVVVAFTYKASELRTPTGPGCESAQLQCPGHRLLTALTGVLMALTLCYLGASLILVLKALHRVQRLPYMDYRTSNITLRLQLRLRAPSVALFVASLICLVLIRLGSCRSQLFVYLGLLPMHLAMTGMAVVASRIVTPTCVLGDDLVLQVWLQEHAWCERDIPHRKAIRRSSVPGNTELDNAPMFCFERALKMHYWSGLVYSFQEAADPEAMEQADGALSLPLAMRLYELQHYELIWEKALDTKCLLAWNSSTIVLAFRGTASATNACTDIKFWLTTHPPKRGLTMLTRPMVHSGFLASWLANGFNQRVMDCINQVLGGKGVKRDSIEVIVTGHSLGGALATLAAYDIRKYCDLDEHSVFCTTFGAPRTGNHAFARDYNAVVPHTWHVINDQDLVTRKGKLGVYKRCGQRVLINALGDLIVRPSWIEVSIRQRGEGSIAEHRLASYNASMMAVCKAQFTEKGSLRGMRGVLGLLESEPMRKLLELDGLSSEAIHELERHAKMCGRHHDRLRIRGNANGSLVGARFSSWQLGEALPTAVQASIRDHAWRPTRLRHLNEAAADAAVTAADSAHNLEHRPHDLAGFATTFGLEQPYTDYAGEGSSHFMSEDKSSIVHDQKEPVAESRLLPGVGPTLDTSFTGIQGQVLASSQSRHKQDSAHRDLTPDSWRDRLARTAPVQRCRSYLRQLLPATHVLRMSDLAAADAAECASPQGMARRSMTGPVDRSGVAQQEAIQQEGDLELGMANLDRDQPAGQALTS